MEFLKDAEKKLANKILFITLGGALLTFFLSIIVFFIIFSNQTFEEKIMSFLHFASSQPFLASLAVSLLILGASLIIIVMTYILINKEIIQPLDRVVFHIEEISKGNLDKEIKVDRKDELGILEDSVERLRISLSILLKKLEEKED